MRYLAILLALIICSTSLAQEPAPAERGAEHGVDNVAHPVLSEDASWTPILMMVIGGMFVAAAVIGPIVRLNMPEEIPPAHAHDEPPGSSHHHGTTGTINPQPEHQEHH